MEDFQFQLRIFQAAESFLKTRWQDLAGGFGGHAFGPGSQLSVFPGKTILWTPSQKDLLRLPISVV